MHIEAAGLGNLVRGVVREGENRRFTVVFNCYLDLMPAFFQIGIYFLLLRRAVVRGKMKTRVTIKDKDGKTMLIWSSNFSVGVNIVFDLNKMLAELMAKQPQYTPSIKEIHHIHKLDAPSGTAKTLAEQIKGEWTNGRMANGEGKNGTEIAIESVREGEVPGTHIVTWDSPEDTIVLTHIAKGRRGFALGAILAAEEIGKGTSIN